MEYCNFVVWNGILVFSGSLKYERLNNPDKMLVSHTHRISVLLKYIISRCWFFSNTKAHYQILLIFVFKFQQVNPKKLSTELLDRMITSSSLNIINFSAPRILISDIFLPSLLTCLKISPSLITKVFSYANCSSS